MWPGSTPPYWHHGKKINALNTFLISHISLILRASAVVKVNLEETRDFALLWTRAHNTTQLLEKCISCHWTWCKERQELGVLVPQVKNTDYTIITPRARTMLERTLKDAICCQYMEHLKWKRDQGKAFEVHVQLERQQPLPPQGQLHPICRLEVHPQGPAQLHPSERSFLPWESGQAMLEVWQCQRDATPHPE
ncbi:hypothetical protein KIL84_008104 [Mauremys mutica]|uniref:Uncharacterized protein n=1 Tax=Mauremys mutica TaxID=74926 RepID=A0A9D3WPJ0_9SAUR|nr:hypothetical protein KIL84_008104 [Mauremys mutica]